MTKWVKHDFCKKGHPLTEDNVYITPSTGDRSCKTCKLVYIKSYHAKHPRFPDEQKSGYRELSRKPMLLITRFELMYIPEPNSGCWLWLGNLHRMGYGRLKEGKRVISAHRFAYEYYRGTIPNGLVIDHLCRLPSCVNPWHMEVVTNTVNILRGESFSARNVRQNHCIHGHLLAGENLQIVVRGTRRWRKCKACEQRRSKQRNDHYAKVKERVKKADTKET